MTRTARVSLEGYEYFEAETSADYPGWVPPAARYYLAHTEKGRTTRDLAREAQVHPSTILRQVRRMEAGRDDPLVDSALRQLSGAPMAPKENEAALAREALPVLRRLAEPEAVLAVARDMEKGVIAQELAGRDPRRLAVVDRLLAEAMALRDWITCPEPTGRIRRYRITAIGRTELKRLGAEPELRGLSEAPTPFLGDQPEPEDDGRLRHMRSVMAESPLLQLSRRKDDKGRPFLNAEQVKAGERLREDYELALRAASTEPDWAAWLARLPDLAHVEERDAATPSGAGRLRVERALLDLGPGLADVALCCCCLTEGLEVFERRMGWSARSGKVVLRIALGRLHQHYRAKAVRRGGLIG